MTEILQPEPGKGLYAIGRTAIRMVDISCEEVLAFARLSGDYSPIHVNEEAAKNRGFEGCVVHGALLMAHVSNLLGMELPGERGLLQSIEMKFRKPACCPCRLMIKLEVMKYFPSVSQLQLSISIESENKLTYATGTAKSIIQ